MKDPTLKDEVSVFLNRIIALNNMEYISDLTEYCLEPCVWITTDAKQPLLTHCAIKSWLNNLLSKVEVVDTDYELQYCSSAGDDTLCHVLYDLSYYFIEFPEKLLFVSIRTSYVLARCDSGWRIRLTHSSIADERLTRPLNSPFYDPFSDS